MSKTLNDTLYDSLLTTEGFIQTIYKDSKGVPTIGVGMALLNKKADNTYEQFSDIDQRLETFLPPIEVRYLITYFFWPLGITFKANPLTISSQI